MMMITREEDFVRVRVSYFIIHSTFTLTTTNVADATNVAYTITGVSSSDLDSGPRRKTAAKDFVTQATQCA